MSSQLYDPDFTYKLTAIRKDGVSFVACVLEVAKRPEFVREFDRLCGCNLSRKGAPIELMIDDATVRLENDLKKFLQFVWDTVFIRLSLTEN